MGKKRLLIVTCTAAMIAGFWWDALSTRRENIQRAQEEEAQRQAAVELIGSRRQQRIEVIQNLASEKISLAEAIEAWRFPAADGDLDLSAHEIAASLIRDACNIRTASGDNEKTVEHFRRKLEQQTK